MTEFITLYFTDATWFLTINGTIVLTWYIIKRRKEITRNEVSEM